MFPKTIVLHLDYHKSLKTPKVTAQDSYYSQRLRTYVFGVYCANEEIIYSFVYDDSIGGTGANEVISLLDFVLTRLCNTLGSHEQLIIWCDNSPSQFKENYLFFYLDHLVKRGDYLRADLKFLLEGHSYSICDRRFGSIQKLFDRHETIEVPQQYAKILQESGLSNVKVQWVTLDMIKDFKSFLRLQYVPRNEDIKKKKFRVKDIAWLNFGYGEKANDEGSLELVHHPDQVFLRFSMDTEEPPTLVSYVKLRQATQLVPGLLETARLESKPVPEDVKSDCQKLAKKYLRSDSAKRFYESLRCAPKVSKGAQNCQNSEDDDDQDLD